MKTGIKTIGIVLLALAFVGSAFAQSKNQDRTQDKNSDKPAAQFPKCSEPISGLSVPNGPHGLFVLMFPGAGLNGKASKYLMHNPVVCGGVIYVVWSQVDRGPNANPRYDWSSVEDQIAPWIAAGKRVSLIVWATGYGANAEATPSYVYDKTPSVTCPSFGHTPVFWDANFMSSYQSFMSAVVDKFARNSSVAYIRFGLGGGGETFPACMFQLKKFGFSDSKWQKYQFDMLDYEKSLNSPKQLAVGISAYGNPPNFAVSGAVAAHAIADGIAIGNQALSAQDASDYAEGKPCHGDWCANEVKARGRVPFILQTAQFGYKGQSSSMGDALPFAMGQGVQVFELTIRHWLVAYDPSDSEYSSSHEREQQAFEAAAKVLGGS
jgi:hypothetical protein